MFENVEIFTTLVASTVHLNDTSEVDAIIMDPNLSVYEMEYGLRLYLDDNIVGYMQGSPYSEGLKLCILAAVSSGCEYLVFDSDGPIYNEVPEYEW